MAAIKLQKRVIGTDLVNQFNALCSSNKQMAFLTVDRLNSKSQVGIFHYTCCYFDGARKIVRFLPAQW